MKKSEIISYVKEKTVKELLEFLQQGLVEDTKIDSEFLSIVFEELNSRQLSRTEWQDYDELLLKYSNTDENENIEDENVIGFEKIQTKKNERTNKSESTEGKNTESYGMKRIYQFLIFITIIVAPLVMFRTCNSCDNQASNKSTKKTQVTNLSSVLKVVAEGYTDKHGWTYCAKLKNVSSGRIDGTFRIKIKLKDGTTTGGYCSIDYLEPGEIQEVIIYNNTEKKFNLSSWSFINE